MKISFARWSVFLTALMFFSFFLSTTLFSLFYQNVPASNSLSEDLLKRPGLVSPMLLSFAFGIGGFVTGCFAIFKKKEKGILVYISTTIGAILCLFLLGEIIAPH